MKKVYLSGLVLSILLSGCGGGGGDGGAANTTPPPSTGTPPPETGNPPPGNDTVKLIESFTDLRTVYTDYMSKIWNAAGNSGILYDMPSCNIAFDYYPNSIKIYSDASVETTHETKNYSYSDLCNVRRVFAVQKINDGKIDANYINGYTFYDESTKYYYDVDYPSYEVTKLTSITNDGMTAVVQYQSGKTGNTKIYRAYKQINLADVGINPKTVPFFNKGKPSDVMETGALTTNILAKTYSLIGNLYLYKTVGVTDNSRLPSAYIIYNNTQIEIGKLGDPNIQKGYISEAFEILYPKNQKAINAQYISDQTFYDSKSKVFFELNYGTSTDMIVDITNDGNTAVLQDGRIKQIVRSYKKVF